MKRGFVLDLPVVASLFKERILGLIEEYVRARRVAYGTIGKKGRDIERKCERANKGVWDDKARIAAEIMSMKPEKRAKALAANLDQEVHEICANKAMQSGMPMIQEGAGYLWILAMECSCQ